MLHDLDARRRLVGERPGYQQVLSPSPPGPERMGEGKDRAGLARSVNEGLRALGQLDLSPEARNKIKSGNARALLRIA